MLKRVWARLYLWWNNVCPKHGCDKMLDGHGGLSCERCHGERRERIGDRIRKALETLSCP